MPNMTLNELRTSLQNFMPEWREIERADDGEIVIHTRLRENKHGELVPIDEEEDEEEATDE